MYCWWTARWSTLGWKEDAGFSGVNSWISHACAGTNSLIKTRRRSVFIWVLGFVMSSVVALDRFFHPHQFLNSSWFISLSIGFCSEIASRLSQSGSIRILRRISRIWGSSKASSYCEAQVNVSTPDFDRARSDASTSWAKLCYTQLEPHTKTISDSTHDPEQISHSPVPFFVGFKEELHRHIR